MERKSRHIAFEYIVRITRNLPPQMTFTTQPFLLDQSNRSFKNRDKHELFGILGVAWG